MAVRDLATRTPSPRTRFGVHRAARERRHLKLVSSPRIPERVETRAKVPIAGEAPQCSSENRSLRPDRHPLQSLPRQGEVACRRHDGGGGYATEDATYLPSVTAAPRTPWQERSFPSRMSIRARPSTTTCHGARNSWAPAFAGALGQFRRDLEPARGGGVARQRPPRLDGVPAPARLIVARPSPMCAPSSEFPGP